MNIDDLTIAQARQIAAMFPSTAAPASPPIAAALLGRTVVVRSHLSGVWCGVLSAATPDGAVALTGARRAYQWTGAGSCSGLALTGPSGGKIAPPVSLVTISAYIEIVECSPAAVAQWAGMPSWTGR